MVVTLGLLAAAGLWDGRGRERTVSIKTPCPQLCQPTGLYRLDQHLVSPFSPQPPSTDFGQQREIN